MLCCIGCSDKKTPDTELAQTKAADTLDRSEGQLMGSLKLDEFTHAGFADKVYVYNLKTTYDADSIGTLYYKIVFFKNDQPVSQFRNTISFSEALGDWSINTDLMNDKKQGAYDRRFVEISNGYPACGYTHTHLLFYIADDSVLQVKEWETMSDGGYGIHTEFFPQLSKGKTLAFAAVDVVVDQAPMEADSIERLEIRYQDSVLYEFRNKKWVPENVTPTDKVYRKKYITFDDYFKVSD